MVNFRAAALAGGVTLATLLAGCSFGGAEEQDDDTPKTLKVMYYDEQQFFQQYGMLYYALHPNVEIEVVSNRSVYTDNANPQESLSDKLNKFIEQEKPDIIMTDNELFRKLAEQGKLLDLETKVKEKSYNADTVVPGLLDYLRGLGGGKLYGLTPNLYSQVIYYNKDLFNKHGVDLPTDSMSWEQMLTLAKRFPTEGEQDDRVYGLALGYQADPFQLGSMIATSQRLSMVNSADMKVTIDTPSWKKAFQTAFDALKSNTLYKQDNNFSGGSYEEYLLSDAFIAGKVAMKVESNYLLSQIKQAQENVQVKDKIIKNWDIVTMPVDPQYPDQSPYGGLSNLFAVSASSPNADTAADFLMYITSEQFARATSKSQQGNQSVRTTAYEDKEGRNMKAFYALKPVDNPMNEMYAKLPTNFWSQMNGTLQPAVQSAYDGNKSLDEALAEAQTQLQAALLQAQQEQKNAPAASAESSAGAASPAAEQSSSVSEAVAQ
ncbi:ABC transporter substrate-binding protein [Cohnella sp. GCM10027633]|uniref:ABC transporter substrate-binding protein n=1 Tax=unclassified Cohnella TaxID=2636738 RepID=UPI00362BAB62